MDLRKPILVSLLLLAAAPARAQFATTACAPPLNPVPGFGPPNWWSGLTGHPYELINDPSDPRWSNAAKQDFAFGANPHVTLRMGTSSDSGVTGIDMQWTAWVDPGMGQSPFEGIWVAISDSTNSGILHLLLSQTASPGTGVPKTLAGIRYWYKTGGAANWVERTDATGAAKPPTWATATARQWLPTAAVGAPYAWVIAVRVPIAAAGTFDNPDAGLSLGATFTLAHEVDASDGGAPASAIAYDWRQQGGLSDPAGAPDSSWPVRWGTVNNGTATCQGISINPGDLSTDYPGDDHAFHRNADNTLHAKPHNSTGADIPGITATFRVADWESQIGEFNSADTPWLTVGTSVAGTVPGAGTMQGDLSYVWAAGSTTYWQDPTQHLDHQCIYVEMRSAATSVLLSPDSAWTNMHFGPASKFQENARVSLKGLAPFTAAPKRDVFLYFEKMNMNALSPPRSLPPSQAGAGGTEVNGEKGTQGERAGAPPALVQPSLALPKLELDNFKTPSYRVHVYHDTGRTFKSPPHQRHKIFEAQGDYGWFINHAGADETTTWTADTDLNPELSQRTPGESPTIEKIRPDWWRVSIGNGAFITLTSTVTATDKVRHAWGWWIVVLIAIFLVAIIVRRKRRH